MTHDFVGFWSRHTHVSSSSGTWFSIYGTENEWETSSEVHSGGGGSGGCCMLDGFWPGGMHTLFYVVNDQGAISLKSITVGGNDVRRRNYSSSGSVNDGVLVRPISDSLAYYTVSRPQGPVVIRRVSPSGVQLHDTLVAGQGAALTISFSDMDNGVVALQGSALSGEVLITTNGGEGWTLSREDAEPWYRSSVWADPGTIYLVGDSGRMIKSMDSGSSWQSLSSPANVNWLSVAARSADSIWVGGSAGALYASVDGGTTWEDQSLQVEKVVRLQVYSTLAYAYTTTPSTFGGITKGLYKLNLDTEGFSGGGTPTDLPWALHPLGIELLLPEEVPLQHIVMFDLLGRPVREMVSGKILLMGHLPNGVYWVRVNTSERVRSGKVTWVTAR